MSEQPESDYIKNAKALLERRDKYVKELEEDYEAAEVTIATLRKRLHDAEAELREYRELGAETGRELVEQRDAAEAERDNWKMLHGRLLLANREVAASEHTALARIVVLESQLEQWLARERAEPVPLRIYERTRALLSPAPEEK